jgi:hypothetical protein
VTVYAPVVTGVRMSGFGYWVVDVSVAPARTVSVMIAVTGISPAQAQELALLQLPDPNRKVPLA